jgi:hypothetical protein
MILWSVAPGPIKVFARIILNKFQFGGLDNGRNPEWFGAKPRIKVTGPRFVLNDEPYFSCPPFPTNL